MKRRTFISSSGALLALSACGQRPRKLQTYNGPKVSFIVVDKALRHMRLISGRRVLENYRIDLGFAPIGNKYFEGDGKTPEGLYYIDRRNPNSSFHLSLGISYPNSRDRAEAAAFGRSPGGDIFIHGHPNGKTPDRKDWTLGCIAVTNDQIEKIYAMVENGTPIQINA